MIVSFGRSSLGASLYMPDDALVQRLRARLPDEFSQNLLQGALDALTQQNVNTRVQHFSVSLRELSNHVLTAIRSSRPDWVAGARIRTWEWRNQNPPILPLISRTILKNRRNLIRFQSIV